MSLSVTNKAMYNQFCRYRIPIYERLGTITYDVPHGMHVSFAFAHIYTVANPGRSGNVLFPAKNMEIRRYKHLDMISRWKIPGTLQLKKYKVGDHVPPVKAMMGDVFDNGSDDEVEVETSPSSLRP